MLLTRKIVNFVTKLWPCLRAEARIGWRPCRPMRSMIAMLTGISLIGLIVGCDEDARLARLAQDAAERQARQNEEMARVVHSSNEAARGLVTADAEAREALLAAQRDLQQQQAVVGQQRDRLETERREMADARRWDSQIGSARVGCGLPSATPKGSYPADQAAYWPRA